MSIGYVVVAFKGTKYERIRLDLCARYIGLGVRCTLHGTCEEDEAQTSGLD